METVAKEYGQEIFRLPPYHCELNPIELAWAAEKNYVAAENKDMSLDSVEKLFRKKREELPEDFWRKCVEHVEKIEENYWNGKSTLASVSKWNSVKVNSLQIVKLSSFTPVLQIRAFKKC